MVFKLKLIILLLASAIGLTLSQQCDVPGQVQGYSIDVTIADSKDLCLQHCKNNVVNCNWYTFDSSINFCSSYLNMSLIDDSCTTCISGEVTCDATSEDQCEINGECSGNLVGYESYTSYNDCLEACKNNDNCQWFTANGDIGVCLLYSNCVLDSQSDCNDCVSAEVNCPPIAPGLQCQIHGECDGNIVGQSVKQDYNQCLDFCQSVTSCQWFTYDPSNDFCILYDSCTIDQLGCPQCLSGEKDCDSIANSDDSKILLIGGRGNFNDCENILLPSVLENGNSYLNCENPPDFPELIEGSVAGVINNKITVCGGGFLNDPVYDECYQLDTENRRWSDSQIDPMFYPRVFAAAINVPNVGFWVTGGISSSGNVVYLSTEYYDEMESTWKYSDNLPMPLFAHCAVQISDTKTFIAGGDSSNNQIALTKAFIYDWETKQWNSVPDMVIGRESPACGLHKDNFNKKYVVVAGGYTGSEDTFTTELYDIDNNSWSNGPEVPVSSTGATLIEDNGSLILVGGAENSFLYKFTGNGWQKVSNIQLNEDSRLFASVTKVSDSMLYGCS